MNEVKLAFGKPTAGEEICERSAATPGELTTS